MGRKPPDDLHLWHHVTRTVTRMRPRKAGLAASLAENAPHPPPAKLEQPPEKKQPAPAAPSVPGKVSSTSIPVPLKTNVAAGGHAGLDRRQHQRLVRGRLPIEATLDLHGHRQAEAHRMLTRFIRDSHARGRRCVLVITGKGLTRGVTYPGDQNGVLRQAVPRWLNEPDLRPLILAIEWSRPQHGGTGALYILLRRAGDRQKNRR